MDTITQAIIKTLIYADLFAWPLTESELYTKLQSKKIINKPAFAKKLQTALKNKYINFSKGFYFLPKKNKLVSKRLTAKPIYAQKLEKAQKLSHLLQFCPGVLAICLTGSMAVGNVKKDDDLDFLIITKPNQLWLARFLVLGMAQLLGVRRKPHDHTVTDKLCLNIFLEEGYLLIPQKIQNLFTAHELVQLQVLAGPEFFYQKIICSNPWIKQYLANAFYICQKKPETGKTYSSNIWTLINKISYQFQMWYMRSKQTRELISYHFAFFHPQDKALEILKRFQTGKKQFGLI
ncbi:hypothetical protein GYA49_00505 [Candidatus Beckwithbacteria bacterium]|nr:hypothetical protein [Candidatus Beckwithbacteria bacterium]